MNEDPPESKSILDIALEVQEAHGPSSLNCNDRVSYMGMIGIVLELLPGGKARVSLGTDELLTLSVSDLLKTGPANHPAVMDPREQRGEDDRLADDYLPEL